MKSTLAGVVLIFLVAVATAETIYVDGVQGDDSYDGLAAAWDGTHGPKASIQAGIDAAQPGDEVLIADGHYTGAGNRDLDFGGQAITVRSAAGDPATCVMDCEGSGRGFHFHAGEGADSIVRGLTIRNAHSDAGTVYCESASPTLVNCIITNCMAADGAGVYCEYGSSPQLTDCTIAENVANCGGGMACYESSSPTLTRCTIRDNLAAYGAGLWCAQASHPILTRCTISGNANGDFGAGLDCYDSSPTLVFCTIANNVTAYGGGGLHCYHASPTLVHCTIANNTGGDCGGGIYCRYDSNPTLTQCTISGNTVNNTGGGIYCHYATATLTFCTITGNAAGYGGGVDCLPDGHPVLVNCSLTANSAAHHGGGLRCYESDPTLINCTIAGNSADQAGGGLYCEYSSSPLLMNCTLTGNSATSGGGVVCAQNACPTLTNCVLWGDAPEEIDWDSGVPIVTFCDVQGGWLWMGNIDAEPVFRDADGPDDDPGTVADNDYRLSRASPCIDAGYNGAVPADGLDLDADGDTGEPQPFDRAGRARFVDDPDTPDTGCGPAPVVDMGAFEYPALHPARGDMNCDGVADFRDIHPFVLALISPADYYASYADCDHRLADLSGDGVVDVHDIGPFVVRLTSR